MRPKWDAKSKKLSVEFHKPDIQLLARARELGESLVAMGQPSGQGLVDAIETILFGDTPDENEE